MRTPPTVRATNGSSPAPISALRAHPEAGVRVREHVLAHYGVVMKSVSAEDADPAAVAEA